MGGFAYMDSSKVKMPSSWELMWSTIQALRQLNGSGSNDEIVEAVKLSGAYSE